MFAELTSSDLLLSLIAAAGGAAILPVAVAAGLEWARGSRIALLLGVSSAVTASLWTVGQDWFHSRPGFLFAVVLCVLASAASLLLLALWRGNWLVASHLDPSRVALLVLALGMLVVAYLLEARADFLIILFVLASVLYRTYLLLIFQRLSPMEREMLAWKIDEQNRDLGRLP